MANEQIHPRVLAALEQDQGILQSFGMTLEKAMDGICEFSVVVPNTLVNAAGFAHGSIAFAMLDTACAYALSSTGARGVTLNANTSYIRGAQAGSKLRASVQVVSRTKRIATLRGEVYLLDVGDAEDAEDAEEEVLAAHGTFIFQLIEPRS